MGSGGVTEEGDATYAANRLDLANSRSHYFGVSVVGAAGAGEAGAGTWVGDSVAVGAGSAGFVASGADAGGALAWESFT